MFALSLTSIEKKTLFSSRSIDNRGITGTALAESTVSAVQAALRRHQTHIHELQVNFSPL